MKRLFLVLGCSSVCLLFHARATCAQITINLPRVSFATGSATAPSPQTPKLSPGAQEVAIELGLVSTLERLYRLPENERCGSSVTLESLVLRQDIADRVQSASLEVDGLF